MRNIAVLILGCASEPYIQLIDTTRSTWASRRLPNIDIYYVHGLPSNPRSRDALSRWMGGEIPEVQDCGGIHLVNNVLLAGCADLIAEQEDCLLRKRLAAFEYLGSQSRYDFIYTVCASSYVDQFELNHHVAGLKSVPLISGVVLTDQSNRIPLISGASMLLSKDIAVDLGRHKEKIIKENQFGFRDDVTIGHWIAKNWSDIPMDRIVSDIRSGGAFPKSSIFVRAATTSVNYVTASPENHLPRRNTFHYHFHSR
jgi:hypothetical protein